MVTHRRDGAVARIDRGNGIPEEERLGLELERVRYRWGGVLRIGGHKDSAGVDIFADGSWEDKIINGRRI